MTKFSEERISLHLLYGERIILPNLALVIFQLITITFWSSARMLRNGFLTLCRDLRNKIRHTKIQIKTQEESGKWKAGDLSARNYYSAGLYSITCPSGRVIEGPPPGTYWRVSKEKLSLLDKDNRIWWGKDGGNVPAMKRFLSEVKQGIVPQTYWDYKEVGHTQEAKKESVVLFGDEVFETPKPEKLMKRIIEIATSPGDLVLDSFAGSGTTGAVAHKMNRRWIMIELGDHCHTHIIPRLRKVIDGEDKGGITEAVNWKGGGFRYYHLAPSLLEKDKWNNWVINKTYNPEMLSQALCKLEGFTYAPSETIYWQQGYSTERDFIYVTTQNLSHQQLTQLSEDVGPHRSLLVLCMAFRGSTDTFSNLTVKKIPKQILHRCEYGHDDYSLKVENLPQAPVEPEPTVGQKSVRAASNPDQLTLEV